MKDEKGVVLNPLHLLRRVSGVSLELIVSSGARLRVYTASGLLRLRRPVKKLEQWYGLKWTPFFGPPPYLDFQLTSRVRKKQPTQPLS